MKITISLLSMAKRENDRLEEIKRPIFEWDEESTIAEVVDIKENPSSIFGEDYINSVTVTTEWTAIPYSELSDLGDRLGMNRRGILFENNTTLFFNRITEDLKDVMDGWRKKWGASKNPFNLKYNKSNGRIVIIPTRRFSLYQLDDLIERLPNSILPYVA